MSNAQKPTYAVGYGKPPVAGQFGKGRSGNPKGRPKKPEAKQIRFGDGHVKQAFEAASLRLLHLTEGGKPITLSAAEAVVRSLQAQAMKGNRLSAQALLKAMREADKKAARAEADRYRYWVAYKAQKEAEIARAKKAGLPLPHPYPHPADIIVDGPNFRVHFIGPLNKECSTRFEHQRLLCDMLLGMEERANRRRGKTAVGEVCPFALQAQLIHDMQPPSYGGGDEAVFIQMTMAWCGLGLRAIERRLGELQREIDALPPLDVPGWLAAREDRIKRNERVLAMLGDSMMAMADAIGDERTLDDEFVAEVVRDALRAHPVEKK